MTICILSDLTYIPSRVASLKRYVDRKLTQWATHTNIEEVFVEVVNGLIHFLKLPYTLATYLLSFVLTSF